MATPTSLMISFLEEQAALLHKHIAILKASEAPSEVAPDAGGKKKNAKKPVDPNMPKRAPSAYLLYMTETQGPFKASNPSMSQAEVVGILGKRWKTIAPETVERYHKAAEALKVSQDLKIAEYRTDNKLPISPVAAKRIKAPVSLLRALVEKPVATVVPSTAAAVQTLAAAVAPAVTVAAAVAPAVTVAAAPVPAVAPILTQPPPLVAVAAPPTPTPKTVVTAPKTPITSPMAVAATLASVPVTKSDTISTEASEVKEHKKKKKRKHGDVTAEAAAEAAPVPAVIEALPAAIPESEKKKKKHKKSKTAEEPLTSNE